jgi:hypothetical protein
MHVVINKPTLKREEETVSNLAPITKAAAKPSISTKKKQILKKNVCNCFI